VGRKKDAEALDTELKRAKRLGGSALAANSRQTLAEFAQIWWRRHAAPNLQRNTLQGYASVLDVHIIPRLGNVRLQALTPELIGDMRAEMAAAGVGAPRPERRWSCFRTSSSARSNGATSTRTRRAGSASQASGGPGSCGHSHPTRSRRCARTCSVKAAISTRR
jgi:hypothetical protein